MGQFEIEVAAPGPTTLEQLIADNPLLMMEAAIVEQLRRNPNIDLHPLLLNAALINHYQGRRELAILYQAYFSVARSAGLPFLMCTPTWRANRRQMTQAGLKSDINGDAVRFMRALRDNWQAAPESALIGGLVGCRNDCYQPDLALPRDESAIFHRWQVRKLAAAGADFLIAETLPGLTEAAGIADAMADTGLPYLISFVIARNGRILDGNSLPEAIELIDSSTVSRPLGYMVNCAHPRFLCADRQPALLFDRLIGCQANASSLDHCDLDRAVDLQADDIDEWGREMRQLNRRYRVKILGGCCGTGIAHLRTLVES